MFKFISLIIYFVKEVMFDNKEESNIMSKQFKPMRFVLFVAMIAVFVLSMFTVGRAVNLAIENNQLRKTLKECKKQLKDSSDSDKIEKVQK